jgi:hypothetical protein
VTEAVRQVVELVRARARQRQASGQLEIAADLDRLAREVLALADRQPTERLGSIECPSCHRIVTVPAAALRRPLRRR